MIHLLLQTTMQAVSGFPQWLIPLCTPVLASVLADLQGYAAARKTDKTATFDMVLFIVRVASGLGVGLLAAMGQSYAMTP